MKIEFFRSFDFNQMLVISVFVHLFLFTVAVLWPHSVTRKTLIVPAFNVALLDIPAGQTSLPKDRLSKPRPETRKSVATKTPDSKPKTVTEKPKSQEPKTVAVKPPPPRPKLQRTELDQVINELAKPLPPPKVMDLPKLLGNLDAGAGNKKKILETIKKLKTENISGDPAKKALLEELEKVARLQPEVLKTPQPPKPKALKPPSAAKSVAPKNNKTILEETIRELEAIKQKKVVATSPRELPRIPENPLEEVQALQMKEKVDFQETKKASKSLKKKSQDGLDLAALPPAVKKGKSAVDLLNELQKIGSPESVVPSIPKVQSPKAASGSKEKRLLSSSDTGKEAFRQVLKKLDSLQGAQVSIDIDVSSGQPRAATFQSSVRQVKGVTQAIVQTREEPVMVSTNTPGPPSASLLEWYIGKVYEKVYSKWKTPLLGSQDNEVVVSFYVYPKGNIDEPVLVGSTGEAKLDSLAVQAVLDADPLPKFPKELKMSNLHVTIRFKYVPEK